MSRLRESLKSLAAFAVLGVVGLLATGYLLVNQRVQNPLRDSYRVTFAFANSSGVVGGLGQPVNVAGVKVGQVVDAKLVEGVAHVTAEIDKRDLPAIYDDATATLEPITPLKDMRISLDPGDPPAPPLRDGATLDVSDTAEPVPLTDLLQSLDVDTRDYLTSLIASLDQGTAGRGADLGRFYATLGPTLRQVRTISTVLAERRAALTRLVSNLGHVTRAASADGRLADVVRAGNRTLNAVAVADRPLRDAIAQLPSTLRVTRSVLQNLEPFARKLPATVQAVTPAVNALPRTLSDFGAFSRAADASLRSEVRPLVRTAQPIVKRLATAVPELAATTPDLSRTFQALQYVVNELAYNPPGDKDEGLMFWLAWFAHNINSTVSSADAHGGIGRVSLFANCPTLEQVPQFRPIYESLGPCGR